MLHSVRMQQKLAKLRLRTRGCGSIISTNNDEESSALTDATSSDYRRAGPDSGSESDSERNYDTDEDPDYRPGVVAGSVHGYSEYSLESLTLTLDNSTVPQQSDTSNRRPQNLEQINTEDATAQWILEAPRHNAHRQNIELVTTMASPAQDCVSIESDATLSYYLPSHSDSASSLTHSESVDGSHTNTDSNTISNHSIHNTDTPSYMGDRCYYGDDWLSVQQFAPPNTPVTLSLDNTSLRSDIHTEQSELEKHILSFIIKRGGSCYLTMQYPSLMFCDILQYLAQGVNLSAYLRCFGGEESDTSKLPFCYTWIDRPSRLKCTHLPARKHFHNALKGTRITKAQYQACRALWDANNCTTFSNFAKLYNVSDVERLPPCIAKHVQFFKELHIDMWRDGLSLPAIAMRHLFSTLDKGVYFVLMDRKNEDFYWKLRRGVQGGLSLVIQRKAVIGEATIRPNGKICNLIKCLDACSLYLGCLQLDMPVNHFCFYNGPEFRRQKCHEYGLMSLEWMECYAQNHNVSIWHRYNMAVEYRVLGRPVDGYIVESKTILDYLGCIWHGCPFTDICGASYKFNTDGTLRTHNPVNKRAFTDLYNNTMERHAALKRADYNLVVMWEHEWLVERQSSHIKVVIDELFYSERYHPRGPMTQNKLIQLIKDGLIFGFGEVTMHCPDHLKSRFADYQPFYKNKEIDITMIGEHMRDFAQSRGLMKEPIKCLILSYYVEKTILLTSLIRWYLQNDLVIDTIHSFYSFKPAKCFTKFVDSIVSARRAADIDPDKRILGELSKYVGNAAIGRSIMQKERHKTIHIANDAQASGYLNNPAFHEIEQLGDDCFEVTMNKKYIKHDLPITLGFSIYNLSKLISLRFVYNFIYRFWLKCDVTLLNHDTDSWWLAMSNSNMEDIIIPELRKEYFQNVHKFLPGEACDRHRALYINRRSNHLEWNISEYPCCLAHNIREQRTPMLFKTEANSSQFFALNPKSYHSTDLHDPDHAKFSHKGISKVHSHLGAQDFIDVLTNKQSKIGTNKSFVTQNSNIYSYEQHRVGLTYLYIKRIVQADGWTTLPTDA